MNNGAFFGESMPENAHLVYNSSMTLSPESMHICRLLCLLEAAVVGGLHLRLRRNSIPA